MIIIHATFAVAPEHRDALVAAMREGQAATRLEPGCVAYHYSVDLDDANLFVLIELWQDEAALERHMRQRHLLAFLRLTRKICRVRSLVHQGPVERYRIRVPDLD